MEKAMHIVPLFQKGNQFDPAADTSRSVDIPLGYGSYLENSSFFADFTYRIRTIIDEPGFMLHVVCAAILAIINKKESCDLYSFFLAKISGYFQKSS